MAFGGNPTVLGSGLPIATGGVGVVSGPASSTDNSIVRWNGTGGNLVQNSVNILSDNGDLLLPSTATLGLQIYNTADQVTNYERIEALWSSNVAIIRSVASGSGTTRDIALRSSTVGVTARGASGSTSGTIQFAGLSTGLASAIGYNFSGQSFTATSGATVGISFTPTYNQASGTAANTDLLVNRTPTAVGSGLQKLADLQSSAATKFSVLQGGLQGLAVVSTATAAGTTTLTALSAMVQIFTGATTQDVNLPAANVLGANVGAKFVISNQSSGIVTINRAGSDTINGATTFPLNQYEAATLISDGASIWAVT